MSFRVIGPDREGRQIGLRRAVVVVLLFESIAKRNMGFGVVRSQFERPLMHGDRISHTALLLQDQSEIVIARGIVRPQRDHPTKRPLGAGKIALLRRYDGKIADRSGVGRINSEHRTVKPLCIVERAPSQRREGLCQQLLRCRTFHGLFVLATGSS
ncbi:MAG TPA: hypothetical protein VFB02_03255 [Bradyrhizobium sp.]|nr:hypothetical protein [Bradyrhizobium sp.]